MLLATTLARLLALALAALAPSGSWAEKQYSYGGVDVTGEHLGVMPKGTGIDFSEPNLGYFCFDSTSTAVTLC